MQGCTPYQKGEFQSKKENFLALWLFLLPAIFFFSYQTQTLEFIGLSGHNFFPFLRHWKIPLSSFCVHLSAILKDKPQPSRGITTQVCHLVYQPNSKRECVGYRLHWEQGFITTCFGEERQSLVKHLCLCACHSTPLHGLLCLLSQLHQIRKLLFCALKSDCSTTAAYKICGLPTCSNLNWMEAALAKQWLCQPLTDESLLAVCWVSSPPPLGQASPTFIPKTPWVQPHTLDS